MSLDPADKTREFTDRFREVWRETQTDNPNAALIGLGRFIFVAETDDEAVKIGRRAYPVWHKSFNHLFYHRGGKGPVHQRPAELDALIKIGQGIAGSPATVTTFLQDQMAQAGCNYLVGQFAFGDLSPKETSRSLALFTKHVMPQLEAKA